MLPLADACGRSQSIAAKSYWGWEVAWSHAGTSGCAQLGRSAEKSILSGQFSRLSLCCWLMWCGSRLVYLGVPLPC